MPNPTTTNDTNDDGRPCPHCRERGGVAPGRRFCDHCLDVAERDAQCATEVYGLADCGDGCDCRDDDDSDTPPAPRHDTHQEATAREALRDVARLSRARAEIADARDTARTEGREAWASLAGHTLVSIAHGITAAGSELARLAVAGVDVHRIAGEVQSERRGA